MKDLDTPWSVLALKAEQYTYTYTYEPFDWFATETEEAIEIIARNVAPRSGFTHVTIAERMRDLLAQGILPDADTPRGTIERVADRVISEIASERL